MLGENKDSNVHSYMQTQSTGIACKTLLTLYLLEHGENEGQCKAETIAMQDCQLTPMAWRRNFWP